MDEAYTSVGTRAAATALSTRALPSTLTSWSCCLSRPGWISQARCTTASASWNSGRSGLRAMSACRHVVFGNDRAGIRRATPSTESIAGSAASERRTLVPTFPLAPSTTTRMLAPQLPAYAQRKLVMHDHGHTHVHTDDSRRLAIALALILGLMAGEVVAGLLADSLALLSDAAHMLTDAGAIGLALFAARLASRPAEGGFTFGFRRAEILSAQLNGATLVALALVIVIEGVRRLINPPEVEGLVVLVVALLGIVLNLAATTVLSGAERRSLNVEGAFQHVL